MRSRSLVSLVVAAACGGKPPASAPSPAPPAPAPVAQAPAPPSAATPDLATRRKQLADLIEERWQYQLRTHPETASVLGDHRYDDRWADHSPEGFAAENAAQRAMLVRFSAIDPTGFPEQEALTRELIVRMLQQAVDTMKFEPWLMSVSQITGVQLWLPQLVADLRFDSVADYEHYLVRLHAIPKVFDNAIALLKLGAAKHLMPPKILLEKTVPQARGLGTGTLADSPFAQPVTRFPAAIAKADRDRLRAAILAAVKDDVQPAYMRFATYLENDYVPHGRSEPGMWSMPDGDARYAAEVKQATTTDLTPAQIHQIGLAEVSRIEGEEARLATRLGFKSLDELRKHVRGDRALYAKSRADILARYEKYTAQMYEKLPSLFGRLPKQRMQVEEVERFREKTAGGADYSQGTTDGSRPGVVRVNTSDPTRRLTLGIESTAYHEGVPGHHLQIAIQQELGDMPELRKQLHYTAYTEGWALYAERLGEDVGLYRDPWSLYGHYEGEMLRAIRLVVDTGFHYKRWTRDQVVTFFHDHSAIAEVEVQSETDRYIATPAQALGYKVGELTILRLRREAQAALGPRFDVRTFHDEVLGAGALPMDVLERRIHAWIERTGAAP